ncbi:cache domain-containing protein [Roseibium sp.]|uniref:sensor histidine kinase n=1 Tax=Roseibium sp. TaxID=1936156 RepID=UPI003A97BF55
MRSVRLKLLLLALSPLVVLLPLLLGVTMMRWIDKFDELLIAKVESDLRIAGQYLGRLEDGLASDISALARSVGFAAARHTQNDEFARFLRDAQDDMGVDFLLFSGNGVGDLPVSFAAVAAAARPEQPSASLVLFSESDLQALSPELAERARIALVPTEAAREIDRDVETRGMVLLAAHRDSEDGSVLVGGRLLNQNLDFIDTMNDLIYRNAHGADVRQGTTTLFLDDVRISTNVRLFAGNRALGTRVSEAVWQKVMQGGEIWLDRAFVVNDWYVSGYEPISDISGSRIGMLYTGFLDAPFTTQRNEMVLSLIAAFIVVAGLTIPLFLHLARGIFAPLEQMTKTMELAELGGLDARIGPVKARDEIGTVARHLDRLLDQVQERDEELRGYADNLNELVDQRTEELREANRKLEATFAQLVISEKLASIGEITAGVAHEINNPVAVIQGNLEVLKAGLGPIAAEHRTELDLIDAQTHRINIIVGKLLDFTRSGEMSEADALVDARQAIEDALVLVTADLRKHFIETLTHHEPAPIIQIVETELQQVLVNLMINAAQAMKNGGLLTINTGPKTREGLSGVEISIRDTGEGISADKLGNVFDPFFTTKLAEGTGLGLSISQALITRAGGLISVESIKGEGSHFSVWLPAAVNLSAA